NAVPGRGRPIVEVIWNHRLVRFELQRELSQRMQGGAVHLPCSYSNATKRRCRLWALSLLRQFVAFDPPNLRDCLLHVRAGAECTLIGSPFLGGGRSEIRTASVVLQRSQRLAPLDRVSELRQEHGDCFVQKSLFHQR